jgi:hypothetical protein
VELRTSNITTTLGDIDVNFAGSEFFNFSKKLQGAKGFAEYDKTSLFISGALTRGRFNSNNFIGIDGVQGPYRLIGADNEVNIVVIAGSEKVYLDGVIMIRGESNDYTIDYSTGQVKFTNRRLITNASRIVVDFQYSDKKYSRSFIAAQTKTSLFKERLNLSFSYFRERDDKDKPIDFILNDTDRAILSQAGSDRFKASKSGVTFAGRDTSGKPLDFMYRFPIHLLMASFTPYTGTLQMIQMHCIRLHFHSLGLVKEIISASAARLTSLLVLVLEATFPLYFSPCLFLTRGGIWV